MAPKGAPKFTSPTKPPESSTMTEEEREEIFHQMEQLEKKMNENREQMVNNMEKKMDENREQMEMNMDEKMEY
jgi:tetrahydromethanopterin S-methyltransferase subunit B